MLSFKWRENEVKLEKLVNKHYLTLTSSKKYKVMDVYNILGDLAVKIKVKEICNVNLAKDEVEKYVIG